MKKSGSIISVNISEKKGEIKIPVSEIIIDKLGVVKDAHAGDWHRQISLLAIESIERFEKILGRKLSYGEFAENITTKGVVLHKMKTGEMFHIGNEVKLEITQIGKKCHGDGCAIFSAVGKCVMPKEGVFAKVIQGGTIKADDIIMHITENERL